MPTIRTEECPGTPLTRAGQQLTPIERATHVVWRGGAYVWRRPVAVEIWQGAQVRRMRIPNATRAIIFGIVAGGLVLSGLAWWGERMVLQRRRAA
jgi:hypothetical protein